MTAGTNKTIATGIAGKTVGTTKPANSLYRDAWRRFRRNKAAVVSLAFIVFIFVVAIAAPLIAPYSYEVQDIRAVTKGPSGTYWLGTDQVGRDVLSRLIYGARVSLLVGVVVQLIIIVIGVPIGLVAGYFGGKIDTILMRIVDILYAKPNLLFIIIVMTFLRAKFQTTTGGFFLPLKVFNEATGGLLGVFIGLVHMGRDSSRV